MGTDKNENWMWRNRIRHLFDRIPGVIYDRIESGETGLGIPDLAISTTAGHGWVELKKGKVKDDFMTCPTLTPVQVSWIKERYRMCRRVWVIVGVNWHDGVHLFLIRGCDVDQLADGVLTENLRHAGHLPPGNRDWPALAEELIDR